MRIFKIIKKIIYSDKYEKGGPLMLKKPLIYLLTLLVFTLNFTGCYQNNQGAKVEKQSSEQNVQKEKIPDQLEEIENNIEKMLKSLKGPAITEEQGDNQGQQGANNQMQQEEQQQKDQQSEDKEKQNQQGQSNEQEQQGNQQEKQQSPQQGQQTQDLWREITNTIHSLHFQWNSFMPLAAKEGANNTLIENFSNSLNELTNIVNMRNEQECMQGLSRLYSYIPDFYALFKTKVSPEIKRIRYFARNAVIVSRIGEWEQAISDINNAKSSWSLFKNSLNQEQQGTASKLDYSLFELEKVINERDQLLTEIKGSVLLSNIASVEKEMEKNQ